MRKEDGWKTNGWADEKNIILDLLIPGGTFLHFGWNSCGMGKKRGFELIEVLLVAHGAGHNDTICIAERNVQTRLF